MTVLGSLAAMTLMSLAMSACSARTTFAGKDKSRHRVVEEPREANETSSRSADAEISSEEADAGQSTQDALESTQDALESTQDTFESTQEITSTQVDIAQTEDATPAGDNTAVDASTNSTEIAANVDLTTLPNCRLVAQPDTIRYGESTRLVLTIPSSATSTTIDAEDVPTVDPQITRSPAESSTFRAEVTLQDGSIITCSADVIVDSSARSSRCFFAVSGVQMGFLSYSELYMLEEYIPNYHTTFPQTRSGNPIGPGEVFDDAGGIFLAARATPYVYGEDGPGITDAVDDSFDSIAVAPGMHATILDGDGNTIFDGDGPIIAESDVVFNAEGAEYSHGRYFEDMRSRSGFPAWIQFYLQTHDHFEVLNLTEARSVQVSRIPNGSCMD